MNTPTFAEHAARARSNARAYGAADCIHYAPNWAARADALYATANEWCAGEGAGTVDWRAVSMSPALIADGRMVVIFSTVWFFER